MGAAGGTKEVSHVQVARLTATAAQSKDGVVIQMLIAILDGMFESQTNGSLLTVL